MNKPTRILTAILVSLLLGGMFAYQDSHKNEPAYQQHPLVCKATDFFGGSLSGLIFYFGTGWLAKRKERKLKQPENDKFYDEVARELQEKSMVAGLWTKAYAEMNGDEAKTRALYIKYRVAQLAEATLQQHNEARLEGQKREQRQRNATKAAEAQRLAAREAAERQARTGADRFYYMILAVISGVIAIVFGVGGLGSLLIPFIPDNSPSSEKIGGLESAFIIAVAIILLLFSYFLGRASRRCLQKTR